MSLKSPNITRFEKRHHDLLFLKIFQFIWTKKSYFKNKFLIFLKWLWLPYFITSKNYSYFPIEKIWFTLSWHPNLTAFLFIRSFSMKYISTHDFTYKTTTFIKISFMEGRVLAILINNYYLIVHELYNKYLHYGCAAENAI